MKRVAFFIPLIFSFLMTINFYAYSADINLNTGWNLISLNNQPTDTDISSVLSSISGKYVSVWAYIDGGWKVYDPENPGFSDLTTMEVGRGYWINMSEFANLPVLGIAPSNSLDLSSGWNLVGYKPMHLHPLKVNISPYGHTWTETGRSMILPILVSAI